MPTYPKLVLLVDDGPNERILFEMAGKKAGVTYELRHAIDGVEAVDYLKGEGQYGDRAKYPFPDLVILDVNMPRMTGFEVLAWIRGHPDLRQLTVIMWTSSSHEEDVRRAYGLLANSYLVKPLSLVVLVDMVRMIDTYWLKLNLLPRVLTPDTLRAKP